MLPRAGRHGEMAAYLIAACEWSICYSFPFRALRWKPDVTALWNRTKAHENDSPPRSNPPAAMAHISPTQFARKTRQCQYRRDRTSGRSR